MGRSCPPVNHTVCSLTPPSGSVGMQVARCFQLGLLLCIAAHRAEAQTTIRTYETPTPHALGAAFNNPFNGGSDQSQGQTFTVPHDDTNLVSFSFWALGFD